jgi:hypothetical protein
MYPIEGYTQCQTPPWQGRSSEESTVACFQGNSIVALINSVLNITIVTGGKLDLVLKPALGITAWDVLWLSSVAQLLLFGDRGTAVS